MTQSIRNFFWRSGWSVGTKLPGCWQLENKNSPLIINNHLFLFDVQTAYSSTKERERERERENKWERERERERVGKKERKKENKWERERERERKKEREKTSKREKEREREKICKGLWTYNKETRFPTPSPTKLSERKLLTDNSFKTR